MLARLARVLLVAEEIGYDVHNPLFSKALNRLREGTEIWLNGSALAPLLYDPAWGGLISCGCDYNWRNSSCFNAYPNCPALSDPGQNFGNAFYNDHHFHYGYHIYAAAVIGKYDHVWGRKYHERVMLFIRDIANPSHEDPFFPTWRHKVGR
jgi:endo-1,3(4)-beta-glucanase